MEKVISEMSAEKIYKQNSKVINQIYKEYKQIGIEKDDYIDKVYLIIEMCKKTYDSKKDFSLYFEEKIEEYFEKYIQIRVNEFEFGLNIINKFINDNFGRIVTAEQSIDNFNKFQDFFSKYGFVPSSDQIMNLVENNKRINRMIELIIKEYRKKLEFRDVQDVFDNEVLVEFVEGYCSYYDIDLGKKDETIENVYYDDNERIFLQEVMKEEVPTLEEEKEYTKRIVQGDKIARKEFIRKNIRLVFFVAKHYQGCGLSMQDLVQEGSVGLITAVDKFDPEKGTKFSTHAVWWIRQSITRALQTSSRTIRYPGHISDKMVKYKRLYKEASIELGREPTNEEMAKRMQEKLSMIEDIREYIQPNLSLEQPVDEEGEYEFGELLPDKNESVEDEIIYKNISLNLENAINESLKERERIVINLRYGLSGGEPMTLEVIATKLGLTKEAVRKIESRSLLKLRKSAYKDILAHYMDNPDESIRMADASVRIYKETGEYAFDESEIDIKVSENHKSLEEQFEGYSLEEIKSVIPTLKPKYQKLIELRYGSDLDNQEYNPMNNKQRRQLYGIVFKNIKKLLDSTKNETIKSVENLKYSLSSDN